jgi:DNA-binding response OmpR family regulator
MDAAPPTGQPSPPTILVVDDEPAIRALLAVFLHDEGYAVRTAPDGRAALVEVARGGVGLVLSHVKMPHLDGVAMTHQLRKRQPALPVVLMSAAPIAGLPLVPVLRKPFALEQVTDLISAALARPKPPVPARRPAS